MTEKKDNKKNSKRSYQHKKVRRQQILFGLLAGVIIISMLISAVAY